LSRKENVKEKLLDEDGACNYQEVIDAGLKIPEDFISEMSEAFTVFDKDKSGYISSKELGSLMRALGKNPTEQELYIIMAEVDLDHNGKLDLKEFIMLMHNMMENKDNDNMEEIQMAFRAFDTDGDGKVSKDELRLSMMSLGQRFKEEQIDDIINKYDKDGDGCLQFEEFVNMFTTDIYKL